MMIHSQLEVGREGEGESERARAREGEIFPHKDV